MSSPWDYDLYLNPGDISEFVSYRLDHHGNLSYQLVQGTITRVTEEHYLITDTDNQEHELPKQKWMPCTAEGDGYEGAPPRAASLHR